MDLRFRQKTQEIVSIEERLNHLSLAYKIIEDKSSDIPALIDGTKEYIGTEQMNAYIDLLDSEKEKWYYCDC